MIFGEPTDFAIEAFHEPSAQEYAGFGRMCLHIQGTLLGKIRENHCSLFHAAYRFRELHSGIGFLWDEAFTGKPDAEIFAILDSALYQDRGESLVQMKSDLSRLGKFDFLTNTGEQFDGFKIFIICRHGKFVHVLYRLRDNSIGAASCSLQSFCAAAQSFTQWFDDQVRTTAPPFFPANPFDPSDTPGN